ncbi:hypothetical protein BDV96DRAFT_497742 [Lophiotrema nucula]|uniref:NAD(P)-binding domain-containing protein n=1 Tax=Lophiotrema nucula TaxID=690887 RepID=A0A6A5Z048_9PLEO|nr:hypothetical protein BDV96DRAFT_497742 [Lophiotrema nucula]
MHSRPSSVTASPASFDATSRYSTPASETSLLLDEPQFLNFSSPNRDRSQYILVVGGLGYIGSHTSLELLRAGYNVVIVDNLYNSYLSTLERIKMLRDEHYQTRLWSPSIDFHQADYRDEHAMSYILNSYRVERSGSTIKGVIHFAAHKAVSESIQQPLRYYSNNVTGIVSFCSLLDRFQIKTLIFSSSAAVYGAITPKSGRISENHCLHETREWIDDAGNVQITQGGCTAITNPYGRSKWMCEAILNDLAISDPEWSIVALRYFNPIGCDASGKLGENPRMEPSNLMPSLMRAMSGQTPHLKVFGTDWETRDGSAVRDFIHVSDLALGHIAALEAVSGSRLQSGFHTYNLGTGFGQSVKEMVSAMQACSGRTICTKEVPRREGDVGTVVADPTRAATELGWKTEKSIEDCCEDLCRLF